MRKKALAIGAVVALVMLLIASFTVYGQNVGSALGRRPGIFAALNLTPDQRQRIVDTIKTYRPKIQPIRQQIRASREQLGQALFADQQDAGQIASLRSSLDGLRAQLAGLATSRLSDISQVLTADQRATIRNRLVTPRPNRAGGNAPRGTGQRPAANPDAFPDLDQDLADF